MKDRQRTSYAAVVLCLNIGVDPPDVMKTQPCSKLEAWVDPTSYPDPKKAIEQIGTQLKVQYEQLSGRTKYKVSLDPNVEDAKRFCTGLRRNAKDDRVLFHYNGHGVPRPTASGEIWVFNRGYTQYIPVSLYDLQSWLGAPCIFVYDCHAAGFIVSNYLRFVEKRKVDEQNGNKDPGVPPAKAFEDCIHLAACASDETLPMHPELPADLFTSCLTSPIEMAVRWFILQSPLTKKYYTDLHIPGRISERRTPLGELNWIFTSITDTIAWTLFPKELFKKLFRQDLVVAALFRNFLLAERIMRMYNCHPISYPSLPATYNHPMWESWDLAIDHCLSQLPDLNNANKPGGQPYEYQYSKFFEEQLTAFELWLKYQSADVDKPPEQLPVVLQVLLSHIHRVRALVLLGRYLDLGPKAVNLALSIGIFPYVLKLLQSPTQEVKPVLVYIWARIMSVDYTTIRQELLKDSGYSYFVNFLLPQGGFLVNISVNAQEHKAMCAFIIALFCRDYKPGQQKCSTLEILGACLEHTFNLESPVLRQWACLCLSQIWDKNIDAKWLGLGANIPDQLSRLLADPVPEIRTSCVLALTNFIGVGDSDNISEELRAQEIKIAQTVLPLASDTSFLVRREVMVFFSRFVKQYLSQMLICAFGSMEDEATLLNIYVPNTSSVYTSPAEGTIFNNIWNALLVASEDPFPNVANFAQQVVDYIIGLLYSTVLKDESEMLADQIVQNTGKNFAKKVEAPVQPLLSTERSENLKSTPSEQDSGFASTLKRSVSFAASIRQAWSGDSSPTTPQVTRTAVSSVPYGYGKRPLCARYKRVDISKKPELPLESGFFAYSCEYYQEPYMRIHEADEPGSERYQKRFWRKTRNEKIMSETQIEKDMALTGNWNSQLMTLNNETQPSKLLFAQFEPHLVAVDTQDSVTVWDWTRRRKLNRFCNGNPVNSRITEAKFMNEDDQPLLLTGSSEGVVRLYRNYESNRKVELVCAWRALTDLLPVNKSSGLVAEWQQSRGSLLVGGDVRVIRVWDAAREICVADIHARSSSPVTSLTSDQVSSHVVVAGFGDGAVRLYDRRLDPRDSMVKCWRTHTSWIVNARMQRGGARELVTASTDGKVCLWDIRLSTPILDFNTRDAQGAQYSQNRHSISVMDLHEHAPVLATGGYTNKNVQLWSTLGVPNSFAKTASGYMVSKVASGGSSTVAGGNARNMLSHLTFHPHRIMLATNSLNDANILVFNCKGE